MKWMNTDLERYIEAKEYVDTLLIPLVPFQMKRDADLVKNSLQSEVFSLFTNELEKELTGRVMLLPTFNYVKSSDLSHELDQIGTWLEEANEQPFKHVFFVTFDAAWRKVEQSLDGTLLWLPITYSGDIHSPEMHTTIRDHVEQVVDLIKSDW
ncbi:MAG TPA: DUF2487 family protein [Virgibacillus sp.]|nr:DUF2487 family protein [Virgibacillus sp.]